MNAQKRDKGKVNQWTDEERAEDKLARDLDVVRRAKVQDVRDYIRRHTKKTNSWATLLRRKLTPEAVAKWESTFGAAWEWLPGRFKGAYIPGYAVTGSRIEWPRVPYFCKAVPCYLCGADFDCKADLVRHWRAAHLGLSTAEVAGLSNHRVEEEVRKRLFFCEMFDGPVEVRGQEMRRTINAYASHEAQTKYAWQRPTQP